MKVAVLGSSTTAVVAATALATTGNNVSLHVPDNSAGKALINSEWPYKEAGLQHSVHEQVVTGRLTVKAACPEQAEADVLWIATEPSELIFVDAFLHALPKLRSPLVAVVQTSFPLGTSEQLDKKLSELFPLRDTAVVCFPEMLEGGVALSSFMRPTNLFAGIEKPFAEATFRELMRPFNRVRDILRVMKLREAEFTKLAINGMLATRLGFMNEMALLAETLNVDIDVIRQGVGGDSRIGESYLYSGCGFGGFKFSQNLKSLVGVLDENGVQDSLLSRVLEVNEQQKELLFRKLWRHYKTRLAGKRVAIWGASYKPGTDRVDNAPALSLIKALLAQKVTVAVHDPKALQALQQELGDINGVEYFDDAYDAVKGADGLMLVTEWKHYWSPEYDRLKALMNAPVILDGRNIYDPEYVKSKGFIYYGIGRG